MGILAIQKGGTGHVLFYTLGYGLAICRMRLRRGHAGARLRRGSHVLARRFYFAQVGGIGRTHPWLAGDADLPAVVSQASCRRRFHWEARDFLRRDGGIASARDRGAPWPRRSPRSTTSACLMFFTEPSEESVVVKSEGLSALAIAVRDWDARPGRLPGSCA